MEEGGGARRHLREEQLRVKGVAVPQMEKQTQKQLQHQHLPRVTGRARDQMKKERGRRGEQVRVCEVGKHELS